MHSFLQTFSLLGLLAIPVSESFAGPVAGQWKVTFESETPGIFNSETGLTTPSYQDPVYMP